MELLITVVYWPALHKPTLKWLATLGNDTLMYHYMVHVHWFPLAGIAAIVLTSNFSFDKSHGWTFGKYGIFYLPINAFGTWQRGKPLYPFMPWTDYKTVVIGLVLLGVGVGSYMLSAILVNSLRRSAWTPGYYKRIE